MLIIFIGPGVIGFLVDCVTHMLLLEEKLGDTHTGHYHNRIGEEPVVLVARDQEFCVARRDWDAGEDHT